MNNYLMQNNITPKNFTNEIQREILLSTSVVKIEIDNKYL